MGGFLLLKPFFRLKRQQIHCSRWSYVHRVQLIESAHRVMHGAAYVFFASFAYVYS